MTLLRIFKLLRRPQTVEANSGGPEALAASLAPKPLPELSRMDVQSAIVMHLEWCMLFNEHLGADPDSLPEPAPLPDAEQSGLSQWIASISKDSTDLHPLLKELAHENRQVHRLARQALDFARSHRMDLASSLLNISFERSRSRVLDILRILQKP